MRDTLVHAISGSVISAIMGLLISAMFLQGWLVYAVVGLLAIIGAVVGPLIMAAERTSQAILYQEKVHIRKD